MLGAKACASRRYCLRSGLILPIRVLNIFCAGASLATRLLVLIRND
jgi:hypothetical protein